MESLDGRIYTTLRVEGIHNAIKVVEKKWQQYVETNY